MKKIRSIEVPQANTIKLVGDILALADTGLSEKRQLAAAVGIHPREIDYYKHAARILGFCTMKNNTIKLTAKGRVYIRAVRLTDKSALLSEAVRDAKVIKALLRSHTESELSVSNIAEFLKTNTYLTGTTIKRRAQSIGAWLKTISEFDPEQFGSLALHASKRAKSANRLYQGGGEGPLHKKLKHALADSPDIIEDNLKLVQEEYVFPTNDRVDLLFLDSKSRFLAVEVEIDVGALDIVGLLQAMKYKMMIMVQFGRPEKGVRGMLAARSIDSVMRSRAKRYKIETKVVKHVI